MDTLCIPVRPDERSLRLVQIDKMASIYRFATSSLVLDAELMGTALDCQPLPMDGHGPDDDTSSSSNRRLSLESRARIACSVWMSRSWTLQEGELPLNIAIQFLDRAVVLGRTSLRDGSYQEQFTAEPPEDPAPLTPTNTLRLTSAGEIELVFQPRSLLESHRSRTKPSKCECIDIDLQNHFYSTFFAESYEFASVWNELSGRSTTMSRDVPVIISNILDLDNRDLLAYRDAGERFLAIMLSVKTLPLSIFYNFAPRQDQDGNHKNRWVPVQIGADTLKSGKSLEIHSSYLLFKHRIGFSDSPKHRVYILNGIMPRAPEVRLWLAGTDKVFIVQQPEFQTDRLDTRAFTSTCMIVEKKANSDRPGVVRGASFYFCQNDELKSQKIRTLDLTYNCPVRVRYTTRSDNLLPEQERKDVLVPVRDECDLRVGYGIFSWLIATE